MRQHIGVQLVIDSNRCKSDQRASTIGPLDLVIRGQDKLLEGRTGIIGIEWPSTNTAAEKSTAAMQKPQRVLFM